MFYKVSFVPSHPGDSQETISTSIKMSEHDVYFKTTTMNVDVCNRFTEFYALSQSYPLCVTTAHITLSNSDGFYTFIYLLRVNLYHY